MLSGILRDQTRELTRAESCATREEKQKAEVRGLRSEISKSDLSPCLAISASPRLRFPPEGAFWPYRP